MAADLVNAMLEWVNEHPTLTLVITVFIVICLDHLSFSDPPP